MRKTKIICTIGPASDSEDKIRELIKAGMDVARLNFSHGSYEYHLSVIKTVRRVSKELNRTIAILQDLPGPKVRVGDIASDGMILKTNQTVILTRDSVKSSVEKIPVQYKQLPDEVEIGDRILIADGTLELEVTDVKRDDIVCRVVRGGLLTSRKGINLPTRSLKASPPTQDDLEKLEFGLKHKVDYVALSFVKSATEIEFTREYMGKFDRQTPVIAKIERREALNHIDEIINSADGIMVARGDLGVEIPLEEVPAKQKMLIRKANEAGKTVITATQMLRSMVDAERPTRAEASDVANAIYDGTDAVMLSEETAIGKYTVAAVEYMSKIAFSAECNYPHYRYLQMTPERWEITGSVAHAACTLAHHLDVKCIAAFTQSGTTARFISMFRPAVPIIALSPNIAVLRQMALMWGVVPEPIESLDDTDTMIDLAAKSIVDKGFAEIGDTMVITAGLPVMSTGKTNMIRVKKVRCN